MEILSVCTGNICRSPMAEGIVRSIYGADGWTATSAGTEALEGNPASEFAVVTAAENGIDITGHRARRLTADIIRSSAFILCMEPAHAERVLSLDLSARRRVFILSDFSEKSRLLGRIPDPYGCSVREYRECFREIMTCIAGFMAEIKAAPRN